MRRLTKVSAPLLALALLTGCAAGKAFSKGESRAQVGDWDAAVTYYRDAVQADANKAEYRIALERAMLNASRVHYDNARQMEQKDQLDAALLEYKKTTEFDPSNRQAADKVVQLEKTIRDRIEASRPRPQIAQLRDQARQRAAEPLLNPRSREPIRAQFIQASLRDILTTITNAAGIDITYDSTFQDRPYTINTTGTLEQVLNSILTTNGLFYSVQDEHTIIVAQDTPAKRLQYERQVIVTYPVSYADATELATMLTQITRTTTAAIPPIITPNKTANSITVRSTQAVMDVIRELIVTNDKPRAEVTLDVEILEVNRSRAKQYGLNLSQYQIGGIFSPEQAPPGALGAPGGSNGTTDSRPFNLNTITQGVSTSDFYLTVPQAIVKFLETDTRTKVLAQTQLRGAEGTQLNLNIGAREPYLTTTFSPIASGGANVNPLSSYSFEQVGITVQATPRVTDEGDILMPLVLKNTALGPSRLVGGSPAPSFTNREVTTNLRLRDGEPHMLAGLLQDEERKTLQGFPGVVSMPILRELFSSTDSEIQQTDIVMLITPRVIRTHEYTARRSQSDLRRNEPELRAHRSAAAHRRAARTNAGAVHATSPASATPGYSSPDRSAGRNSRTGDHAVSAGASACTTADDATADCAAGIGCRTAGGTSDQSRRTANTWRTPAAAAQITVTPPPDVRVAGGPYMMPVFVTGASRLSTITVTVTFNPAVLRVRTIQEGSFLRQGAAPVTFTNKVDATLGRVDLTFVRTGDAVGASGSGLLAGIMFDAVASGTSQLNVSGAATDPSGTSVAMQFTPVSVVVR